MSTLVTFYIYNSYFGNHGKLLSLIFLTRKSRYLTGMNIKKMKILKKTWKRITKGKIRKFENFNHQF